MKQVVYMVAACMVVAMSDLDALPKFASRVGAKCQACHVNPTGKGMRNTFGSTYGREELPMPTFKEATDIDDFSPALTENFTLGFDYRSIFLYSEGSSTSSFFQMQGDLYLDLRLNKKFRIYLDKGIYTGFEIFGLAKVLPLDGYLKVGKFIPAYGIKIDDHNVYTRGGPYLGGPSTGLRFSQRAEDTGIEVGVSPGIFTLNLGIFNGVPGSNSGAPDIAKTKVMSLRGDATLQMDEVNLNLGGSFYNDPSSTRRAQFYGAFGSVSFLKTLTLTSEFDYVTTRPLTKDVIGLAVYNEINYMAVPGVDLKAGYEFFDPDKDQKTGSYTRYTVGAEFFPLSGVEVRPLYRISKEEPTEVDNNEFLVMFHFYL